MTKSKNISVEEKNHWEQNLMNENMIRNFQNAIYRSV